MEFDQRLRQPDRRGALDRAEAQEPSRLGIVHRLARLVGEAEQAVGIVEQDRAGRRQVELFAVSEEQLDAEVLLELLDAGGDVRLHPAELLGGARDPAGLHHGTEYLEVGKIHGRSLSRCDDLNGIISI